MIHLTQIESQPVKMGMKEWRLNPGDIALLPLVNGNRLLIPISH